MMMMMMMILVVAVVMLVTTATRNKKKFVFYLEVRGVRTVRFYCKVMCACFEEFFKTVEWQLVHPGSDE
jgi:ABC-type glycerol-3-phosphate transport system substrate-binding protein